MQHAGVFAAFSPKVVIHFDGKLVSAHGPEIRGTETPGGASSDKNRIPLFGSGVIVVIWSSVVIKSSHFILLQIKFGKASVFKHGGDSAAAVQPVAGCFHFLPVTERHAEIVFVQFNLADITF
jgi:hypothetical protein